MKKRKPVRKKKGIKKVLTPKELYGPLNDTIRKYREASYTRKFHAIPGHDYTVGQHSHLTLQLLFLLNPNPSMALVKTAAALGTASRWLGDKTPQSGLISDLANMRAAAERNILAELKLGYQLNEDEQEWIAGLDLTAVYLWCQDQIMLGNRNAVALYRAVEAEIKGREKLPEQIKAFLSVSDWERIGP